MLIFLSVVATTLGAVSLTSDTVLAGGGSGGGGTGGFGGSQGGSASSYESLYDGQDGGYRIFLIPSKKFMDYTYHEKPEELHFMVGEKYYQKDDWLSMATSKPAYSSSENLRQNEEYYNTVKLYANLGAYEITSGSNVSVYAYAKGSTYMSHYTTSVQRQLMGSTASRSMTFKPIFGDNSTPLRINNRFSGGTNYTSGSGALPVWGDRMFKFPDNLSKYENRVQQIKNWMKKLGRKYYVDTYGATHRDKIGEAYDTIMSTPNSELDIVIEPLILVHPPGSTGNWDTVSVYSWMDVLMATKKKQGLGVSDVNKKNASAVSYWYHQFKDFGSQCVPSRMIQFGIRSNFKLTKHNGTYINAYASKYQTTTNCKEFKYIDLHGGEPGNRTDVDAFRQGFVHYTPYEAGGTTNRMGVSHNIVVLDKSDVMGVVSGSGSSKAPIDEKDVVVTYGGSTIASDVDTDNNTLKRNSPAYNTLNTRQYLVAAGGGSKDADAMKAFDTLSKLHTKTVKNTVTNKNMDLSTSTFSRLVYSGMGAKYYNEYGTYALLSKERADGKNYYNKTIADIGGITWQGATDKLRSYSADWFFGDNAGVPPRNYGVFIYAGLAGMQDCEWDLALRTNEYDIVTISTAEIKHKGIKRGKQMYPYNILTVGGGKGRGYMSNYFRTLKKNFYKTVTKKNLTTSNTSSTDVFGSEFKNDLKYAVSSSDSTNNSTLNSRGFSGIFSYEIIKQRNTKYGADHTSLTADVSVGSSPTHGTTTSSVNPIGKRMIPSAEASAIMSSSNAKAFEYKRDLIYNLWGVSAASSKIDAFKTKSNMSIVPEKNSAETVTVTVFQKKKTVTSYLSFARLQTDARDEEGRDLVYSLADTSAGAYKKYSVASFGKFTVDPKKGSGAIMSEVSSTSNNHHFLITWSSNQVPSNASFDYKKSSRETVAQSIGSAFADYANSNGGLGSGGSDTTNKIKAFFRDVVGIQSVTVKKKNNKDTFTIATGATASNEGKLDGYSNIVLSWDGWTKPEVSMDGLKPHEFNVLLPDMLGFKHIYGENKNHHYTNTYSTADEIHPIPTVVIDVRWHHWYENGGVRSTSHLHCSIPYQVTVPDYGYVWYPPVYDKKGNLVTPGQNKWEQIGSHKETRYNNYYYNTYWYQSSHGDMTDRYDYNVVPPYQIWDKFEGDGIAQNIPDGKNTAFFYYNYENTGLFRQRRYERSMTFSSGTSTVPSYLYSLSRRVWQDMVVGCNFVGSLSSEGNSKYASFFRRTVGLNLGNKPSGQSYIDTHKGKKGQIAENNTKQAVEKKYDTVTFEIVPNRAKTNEGGAVKKSRTYTRSDYCGYCKATFTSTIVDLTGSRGDTESSCTRYNGHGWKDETLKQGFLINGSVVNREAKYTVYHYMTKYAPITKPFGTIGVENKIHRAQKGTDKFEWNVLFEEEANEALHIYPEVEMRLYYANDDSGSATTEIVPNSYSMGEIERNFAATSLRLVNLKGSDGSFYNGSNDRKFLTAKLTSDTVAQTGDAKSLQSSHRTDDGRLLPIIYAGGNYNLKIRNEFNIEVISYTLDIEDTHNGVTIKGGSAGFDSRNDIWSTTKIRQAHLQTVTSIINGLELSMKMQTTTGYSGRFSSSPVKTYNDLKIAGTKIKTPETVANDVFHLKFKEGAYLENGTGKYTLEGLRPLIQDVAREYNISESEARKVVEDSGIVKSVKMALESRFDANNHSTVEKGFHDGNKWYDEESSVIIVRKLKSKINLGDVVVTDKVDLTAGPKRTKADRSNFFQNSYNAAFYYYLNLKTSELNLPDDADDPNALMWKLANGSFVDVSKYKAVVDAFHVKDGDFLIPTATTSDMRNNI